MGELTGCQLGHYRLVPVLAWDCAEVKEKETGFRLMFCQLCKVSRSPLEQLRSFTSSGCFHLGQKDLNDGLQRRCDVFWHGRWTECLRCHLELTVHASPVQWAVWATNRNPQPDACSLMFAASSSENIPGHTELFIMWLQHVLWLSQLGNSDSFLGGCWVVGQLNTKAVLLSKSNSTPFPSLHRLLLYRPGCL